MAMLTSTALALGALVVGAAGATTAAVQGADAKRRGMYANQRQQTAQKQAEAAAISQQRKADMAIAAANRQAPDINTLLTAEQKASKQGAGSTLLTGAGGVDPNSLLLGKKSLLGA